MQLLVKIVFWTSLLLTLVGWWQRNDFVPVAPSIAQLNAEPAQKPVRKSGFRVEFNAVTYNVLPKHVSRSRPCRWKSWMLPIGI